MPVVSFKQFPVRVGVRVGVGVRLRVKVSRVSSCSYTRVPVA